MNEIAKKVLVEAIALREERAKHWDAEAEAAAELLNGRRAEAERLRAEAQEMRAELMRDAGPVAEEFIAQLSKWLR